MFEKTNDWSSMGTQKRNNPSAGEAGTAGGSEGKESACNAEDQGSIPGLGRSPGEEGNPLQHFHRRIP